LQDYEGRSKLDCDINNLKWEGELEETPHDIDLHGKRIKETTFQFAPHKSSTMTVLHKIKQPITSSI
jgi:hypothetical protein